MSKPKRMKAFTEYCIVNSQGRVWSGPSNFKRSQCIHYFLEFGPVVQPDYKTSDAKRWAFCRKQGWRVAKVRVEEVEG